MANCTGKRCPMQVGYKVDECNHKDCTYRTEPITNADRIRAMSDEELAEFLDDTQRKECESLHILNDDGTMKFESLKTGWLIWLQQPAEEDDNG